MWKTKSRLRNSLLGLALVCVVQHGSGQPFCGTATLTCDDIAFLSSDPDLGCADTRYFLNANAIVIWGMFPQGACVFCSVGCSACLYFDAEIEVYDCNIGGWFYTVSMCCRDPVCCPSE